MAITKNSTSWFGLSTDTKPTAVLAGQLGSPLTGDSFRETDTGKSYLWVGSAWVGLASATAAASDAGGNTITYTSTPSGLALPVTPTLSILLNDNFNGTIIDTVNRWGSPVLAGAGTMTQAGGALVTTLGTTASNGASITSIESFEPTSGYVSCATLISLEATPGINTNRCVGIYTKPGSFTAATPVQDGYVIELDIAGTFGASIYSGGARIFRQVYPLNGATFVPVLISYESLNMSFYIGNFTTPFVSVPILQPSTVNLPVGFHSINHTAGPVGAPTWNISILGVADASGTLNTQFNGQTISRVRSPAKFIPINAASVAAEVTIWTPTAGRKFRLMGYVLESGTIGGNIILKDNTAGTTILVIPFGAANGVIVSPPMGNGILSAAVNNVLTATGTATQTLSGYVFGCEE